MVLLSASMFLHKSFAIQDRLKKKTAKMIATRKGNIWRAKMVRIVKMEEWQVALKAPKHRLYAELAATRRTGSIDSL